MDPKMCGVKRKRDTEWEKKFLDTVERKRKEMEFSEGGKWEVVTDPINELSIVYAPSYEPIDGEVRDDLFERMPPGGLVVHALFSSTLYSLVETKTKEKVAVGVKPINPKIIYNIGEVPSWLCMPSDTLKPEVMAEMNDVWIPLKGGVDSDDFYNKIWHKHASYQVFRGNYFEETLKISRSIVREDGLMKFLKVDKNYQMNCDYESNDLANDLESYFGVPIKLIFGNSGANRCWSGVNILYTEDLKERIPYPPYRNDFGIFRFESVGYHEFVRLKGAYEWESGQS